MCRSKTERALRMSLAINDAFPNAKLTSATT